MLKICLVSDNHGDLDCIERILSDNPACDYYLHCGDVMAAPENIAPFAAVSGNNDWFFEYPMQMIMEIGGHRILIMHGHKLIYSWNLMVDKAKKEKCDVVFYGHTHSFYDDIHNGIRFINPGSCHYNRDLTAPCYARVYILDDGNIRVERVDL